MVQLEIACFTIESVRIAQQNGADRIELCAQMEVGGTTPDIKMVNQARTISAIDLYVMIRPRGGNFVYNEPEFQQMKLDILELKKHRVNGFVFGILDENHQVNITQNSELVELAKPFPCTFHRAFDEVSDAFQSLEQIIDCGFKTILTSGQEPSVSEGANRLEELVNVAGKRIVIMPGGGLRSSNIESIQQKTKASFYHSSAITDNGQTAVAEEVKALKSKLK